MSGVRAIVAGSSSYIVLGHCSLVWYRWICHGFVSTGVWPLFLAAMNSTRAGLLTSLCICRIRKWRLPDVYQRFVCFGSWFLRMRIGVWLQIIILSFYNRGWYWSLMRMRHRWARCSGILWFNVFLFLTISEMQCICERKNAYYINMLLSFIKRFCPDNDSF
jgi:hypothetical protein